MQISEKYLNEFKELLKKKMGKDDFNKLSEQEILDNAIKLITLVKAIYQPIKKEDYDKYTREEARIKKLKKAEKLKLIK